MSKDQGAARAARAVGVLMLCEAVTLGLASYLHLQGRIPLGFTTVAGESFRSAAIPEAVIGTVLAAAGTIVLIAPRAPTWIPTAATGFAIAGVAVGMTALLAGSRRDITTDLVYHSALMAALLATLAMLRLRSAPSDTPAMPSRRGGSRAAGAQRGRRFRAPGNFPGARNDIEDIAGKRRL